MPVVAEEAVEAGTLPAVGREFFLVDPLDGTKEFVKGGDDFTVNIALIRDRVPVVGLVLAPAAGTLYVGVAGEGAWTAEVAGCAGDRRPITSARAPGAAIDVVARKSHRTPETDDYIARYKVGDLVSAGSSLKFCLVAEGKADLYPRMGTTMQWDTAAGDAVLRAAGGTVGAVDGARVRLRPERRRRRRRLPEPVVHRRRQGAYSVGVSQQVRGRVAFFEARRKRRAPQHEGPWFASVSDASYCSACGK